MTAQGVLEDFRLKDTFFEQPELIRPGTYAPSSLVRATTRLQRADSIDAMVRETVVRSRDFALASTKAVPSATTFSALAQAHVSLNEDEEAAEAASRALSLLLQSEMRSDAAQSLSSARIAVEVLLRTGHTAEAREALQILPATGSLALLRAMVATESGDADTALAALDGFSGPLHDSFRGYVLANRGDYLASIPYLRSALRENTDDADAAFNLSVALWNVGSSQKAIAAALRATRSAPGRKDFSMHYLELLLATERHERAASEVRRLVEAKVTRDSNFMVIQARLMLAQGDTGRAITALDAAVRTAREEDDKFAEATISANLLALRFDAGRIGFTEFSAAATNLRERFPDNEVVVLIFARATDRRSQAGALREAIERVAARTTPARLAFLQHHLAFLEGDNEAAGAAATEWFESDPREPAAAAAALVALGIGLERWEEASKIADYAISSLPMQPVLANNVGYVLAMTGRPNEAIRLLEPVAERDPGFIVRATLGLCYLAANDIDRGMRLYREAAERAERIGQFWASLMTAYQAVIARQLGLDQTASRVVLDALSLAPRQLPDDWSDRPDFLRLHYVCQKRGYNWPPHL